MSDLAAVRRALVEAYTRLQEIDGCVEGKSGEMLVTVEYPTWWDVQDGADPMEPTALMVYSYTLGPSRSHYFYRAEKESHPNYYTWYGPNPFAIAERVIREEWWPTPAECEAREP